MKVLFLQARLPSRSPRRSAMRLSGYADSAFRATRSSRPILHATRTRSSLPTFSSSSLTTRTTSLLLLAVNEKAGPSNACYLAHPKTFTNGNKRRSLTTRESHVANTNASKARPDQGNISLCHWSGYRPTSRLDVDQERALVDDSSSGSDMDSKVLPKSRLVYTGSCLLVVLVLGR